jgi:hypothetical protein
LEALETEEVIAGIAAGEEQFARGEFKTLAEARAIAEEAWKKQETHKLYSSCAPKIAFA